MLYIRTDMNDVIATGHLMRCLSIAEAARFLGEETVFILADNQAVNILENKKYKYCILNTCWNEMDSELPALIDIIKEKQVKRLLLDSYQVTDNYLNELQKYTKIYYLDDLNRFHYSVEAIICYENYWKSYRYQEEYRKSKLYLGTQYVPLRKEFLNCARRTVNAKVEKLLVLSGGTDPYDFIEKILNKLELEKFKLVTVICGRYYEKFIVLCDKYKFRSNIQIYQSVSDIEDYMKDADLAISAGGITIYELCACGTPTISYSMADNQLDTVKTFAQDGVIDYAGDVRDEDITDNIIKYIEKNADFKLRQMRADKMQKLVDGKGALRIAEVLLSGIS